MARRSIGEWLNASWRAVMLLGTNPLAAGRAPHVVATNQFAVMALLVNLPYLIFFLGYPGGQLLPAAALHGGLLACWVVALAANARGWHLAATLITLVAPLVELSSLTALLSADAGFHLLMMVGAAVAVTMMPPGRPASSIVAVGLVGAVMIVLQERYARGPQWTPVASEPLMAGFQALNLALALIGVFGVVRFSHYYLVRERAKNRRLLEVAQAAAQTDALTNVFNRRGVAPVLSAVARAGDYTLALVDLDRFKLINDRLGHGAGDVVLANVARTLVDAVGDAGTVARWGGEEFLIVLPAATAGDAEGLLERVRAEVEEVHGSPESRVVVTTSIGFARAPRFAGKDEVLRLADRYLYEAKSSGRNLVVGGALADPERRFPTR